jgi:hypothetical protein
LDCELQIADNFWVIMAGYLRFAFPDGMAGEFKRMCGGLPQIKINNQKSSIINQFSA